MAYQSLYRRYRSRRFGELVGQQHVVTALRNAVRDGRTGHAYLFSGPRGTGKTSVARILAKALNCTDLQDGEPCGRCESCIAVDAGRSLDLHELDAASNNGVEAMRDLINRASISSPGQSKVYILDEVHMLSTAASNALLKTLEEPPGHVTFVLATTDPQKVLPTIRSRCQHLEFGLIAADELDAHVRAVAADAGIPLDDEAVAYVVRKGAGSARDTLSVLEQVAALGRVPSDGEPLDELVDALVERDGARALAGVAQLVANGREPRLIGEALLARLRDAFLSTMGAPVTGLPEGELAEAARIGRALGPAALTRALEALGEALVEMRQAPDARVPLEVALIRLTRPDLDTSVAALVERVAHLERQLAERGAGSQHAAAEPGPADAAGAPAADDSAGGVVPGGAASEARRRIQARSDPPSRARAEVSPTAPAAPAPAAAFPAATPEPAPPDPAPATASSGDAGLPSAEELAAAWSSAILDTLAPAAKARYRAGRFLGVDDAATASAAVYGLPNAIHRDRCEEKRAEVEAALARHFGRPVPLRLTVDEAAGAAPPDAAPPPFGRTSGADQHRLADADAGDRRERRSALADGASPDRPVRRDVDSDDGREDIVDVDLDDLHALPDATDVVATVTDRLMQAFPGSQVVE